MGKIKNLPVLERPRERALRFGISTLSSSELLAIIIGSGTKNKSALDIANELLSKYNGIENLMRVDQTILTETKGISVATSLRIASCFELANKVNQNNENDTLNFMGIYANIIEKYELMLKDQKQEHLYLISMNLRGKIISEKLLYLGTERQANVSAKEVLKHSLISHAKNIILIHNHPNGLMEPSDFDILFTNEVISECKRFHIKVFDHLIMGPSGHLSMLKRME